MLNEISTGTEPLNEEGSPPTSRSLNSEARDGGLDGPDNVPTCVI